MFRSAALPFMMEVCVHCVCVSALCVCECVCVVYIVCVLSGK